MDGIPHRFAQCAGTEPSRILGARLWSRNLFAENVLWRRLAAGYGGGLQRGWRSRHGSCLKRCAFDDVTRTALIVSSCAKTTVHVTLTTSLSAVCFVRLQHSLHVTPVHNSS